MVHTIPSLFHKNELQEYVSGKILVPKNKEEQKIFEKKDLQTRAEILLLKQLKGYVTSKQIRVQDKLKSIQKSIGPAGKATLLEQLVSKRMESSDDISDYFNNFMDIVEKLHEMNVEVN